MLPLTFSNPWRGNRYICSFLLGSGGFGQVWYGRLVNNKGQFDVAIKIFRSTSDSARDRSNWYKEQKIYLECLNHPHIVTTYDQFTTTQGHLVIIMERGKSNLLSLIDSGQSFTPEDVCRFGLQMARALKHLHEKNIIHRDISPDNILQFDNGIFKLCDFSAARLDIRSWDYARTVIGHINYLPPELLIPNGFSNYKSDFYQLGLVMLAMLIGKHVIPQYLNHLTIKNQILTGIPRQTAESLIPSYGKLAWVLRSMLQRTNANRHSSADALMKDLNLALKEIESFNRSLFQYSNLNKNLFGSRTNFGIGF